MSPANCAIKRTRHQIPTIEEQADKMEGATVFSAFDLSHGFHQAELDEASRHISTFRAPSGLYRCKRCPQGGTSIPEIFHNTIETEVVQGLKRTLNIHDDMILCGVDAEDHDRNVDAFLKR